MRKPVRVELLSPAKDLECGMEAINHGADAVYIGAPRFGARASAGNSVKDIRLLCDYAHQFDARIYVTVNTILWEEELRDAEHLIWQMYDSGVDALIVQDMGITKLNLPPIPLHASTQTDNRTVEKVKFLEDVGFSQVVLARELSLDEIRNIREKTTVPLEVFVHGALCVSYSGQCYLSAARNGRSANRGECAQLCRLPYDMVDAEGRAIVKDKHLLSLKDMNRSADIEALLDAGATSFKIEGRLKDVTYVKNITAYYRQCIDEIISRRPDCFVRSSSGHTRFSFVPVPEKSFNRGFTPFFLHGRDKDIAAFDTPKSQGEYVGRVKTVEGRAFTLAGTAEINNGDGLDFFNRQGVLEGVRVNKVEKNRIFPLSMPSLKPGVAVYRNFDQNFSRCLSKPSAERKISVNILFSDVPNGFSLELTDETGARTVLVMPLEKSVARKNQTEIIHSQLSKMGNTIFEVSELEIQMSNDFFIPSSLLAELRRQAVDKLLQVRKIRYRRELRRFEQTHIHYQEKTLSYLGNVSNRLARTFYYDHGVKQVDDAFEVKPQGNVPLMFTRHCLRYSMGWCPVYQKKKSPYREPYFLQDKNGVRLRLHFNCKQCRMEIYAAE